MFAGTSATPAWPMASQLITERSFQFAVHIVRPCDRLWAGDCAARKIADQLFDSGTSISPAGLVEPRAVADPLMVGITVGLSLPDVVDG
jgi:hypothetical protein